MPAGMAHLPGRLARAPRRPPALVLGALVATLAILMLVVGVAVTAPRLGSMFRVPVTTEAAAALLGIPVAQVVETRDGVVGFEVVVGAEPVMLVYLVRSGDEGLVEELLVRMAVAPELFDDQSATVWGNWISCSAARGLDQPNFVVGGGNPPPEYVGVAQASDTAHVGRFFLSVLGPADIAEPIIASMGNASFTTTADAFDGGNACRGEMIREH